MKGLAGKKGLRAIGRKVVTFLALVCFCAATLPIPVATLDILDKGESQPFPCQNHPCGCKTAEQCWTNCCCFTPAERLAWAKKNGVTPPSYAQRPTSDETTRQSSSISSNVGNVTAEAKSTCCEPRKACCEKHATMAVFKPNTIGPGKPEGCDAAATKSSGSCCLSSKTDKAGSKATSSPTKRKVVLSMFALKCQGKSSAFTMLPWTILATIQKVVMIEHESGPAHQATTIDPAPVYSKPDTPPPKRMLS